jgi:hypothetical protein
MADMCRLNWGLGGNELRWCRRLFAWKEQLCDECRTVVANVVLQVDTSAGGSGCLILIHVIH